MMALLITAECTLSFFSFLHGWITRNSGQNVAHGTEAKSRLLWSVCACQNTSSKRGDLAHLHTEDTSLVSSK